ncbi:hypothetical protein GCE9029_01019 [Grimontia celer]|uniref:Uncharacterized protein n=1 Tax=Grimontia celer TaxID=1796497 RepID=A0A128EVW4_9GAMM|nr:hypothetical protein [Grimontia celer]CZF78728.1 hypothetical protein GCE9029_01019 [Grimontia celer]
MVYDIDKRTFTIELVDNVEDFNPHTRLVCESARTYKENIEDEDYDDDLIDGLIDFNWSEEMKSVYVLTEQKEILLEVERQPYTKNVSHESL